MTKERPGLLQEARRKEKNRLNNGMRTLRLCLVCCSALVFREINCELVCSVGFDDFFTKPVDLQILLKAANDAVEKVESWKFVDYNLI